MCTSVLLYSTSLTKSWKTVAIRCISHLINRRLPVQLGRLVYLELTNCMTLRYHCTSPWISRHCVRSYCRQKNSWYPLQPHETVCSGKRGHEKKGTQTVLPERPGKESVKLPWMFLELCGGRDDVRERIAARKSIGGRVLLTGSCGGDSVNRPLLSTNLSVIKRGGNKCILHGYYCIPGGAKVTWLSCVYMTSDFCSTLCDWVDSNIGIYVTKLYRVMSQKCAIFWGTEFKYWPAYRIYAFFNSFLQSVQKNAGILSQIRRRPLPFMCCPIYLLYSHHSTICSQTAIERHPDWTPSETQEQKFPVIRYLNLP